MSTPPPSAVANVAAAGPADCLLVFGAAWSVVGSAVAERARRVASRQGLAVLAVDADATRDLARRYRVTAVPSLLLCRRGQEIDRRIGEVSERDLEDWLALALVEG